MRPLAKTANRLLAAGLAGGLAVAGGWAAPPPAGAAEAQPGPVAPPPDAPAEPPAVLPSGAPTPVEAPPLPPAAVPAPTSVAPPAGVAAPAEAVALPPAPAYPAPTAPPVPLSQSWPPPAPPAYPPPVEPTPSPSASPVVAAQATPARTAARPAQWGAGVDLGFSGVLPDLGLLAAWRPYSWLHARAGLGWNLISPGIRCGVTAINPWLVPISLTGELGHYFEGDANGMIKRLTGQDSDIAVLRKVSYNYANALVGFTSRATHFVFYFRVGVTRMWATVNNFEETVSQLAGTSMETSAAKVSYYGPTVKLGLVVLY